ncbi:MAG: hypothetical protein LLG97_19370 [Deltaproteobacteria bacterium]|nr:hypothetical protein [Deltaproteobacteria bacterium]
MQETVRAAVTTYYSPDGAEITEKEYLKLQYPDRETAERAEPIAADDSAKQEAPAPSGSSRKRR